MTWLILSLLLWGLLHSLLASRTAKELAQRWLGDRAARFYRLGYNIFACLSFLPVLALTAIAPDRALYLVPLPWSALMVLGMALAVAALVAGFLQTDAWEFLGLRQANGPLETRGGTLVTSGLYRYVRHPLYSAGIAFIWLMPLMTANVLAINAALTIYVIVGAVFEERKLRREFGQVYTDYQHATPMFIPFLRFRRNK
ncbi:MAG: isoprenylcysteine carboxylmethyltransferase family protein [Chloroflexi bacterium]|nr:isoprenylcysteine carboxylmethyltransferase family protein [Chloroflexota bacterium]